MSPRNEDLKKFDASSEHWHSTQPKHQPVSIGKTPNNARKQEAAEML